MLKNIVNVARNALAHPLGGKRPLATLGRVAVWQWNSSICGARTWAFEPDPSTINNLSANIEANVIGSLARVIPTALGAENGEIGFTIGLNDFTTRFVGCYRTCHWASMPLNDVSFGMKLSC